MTKRALVTGGAGFIGSHIVESLLAEGFSVSVMDDLSSGKRENLPSEIELVVEDIRSASAASFIAECKPDVLVHAAAQMSVRKSMEDPVFDTDVNVKGLVNLLSACRSSDCKPSIVFLSTGGAIYGEQDEFPASEDHPIRPTSVYGLAKRVGEMYLEFWCREFGFDALSLRLANVYGPRQNPHGEAGVVAIFHERLLAGEPVTIFGDGGQTRDFVFVKDVAQAVVCGLRSGHTGSVNIGTSVETSVTDLYAVIQNGLGTELEAIFQDAREGEQQRSCIDPQKAADVIGWTPSQSLEEGMQQTSQWYKQAFAS